jgi:EAL domain-containing protein (putative c-di-GMP-specific phosphodiesterase class I)
VVSFFSDDLDVRVKERDTLINQLIRAETSSEFDLHFQPIASLSTGRVEAVEALLRWNHPDRGLMPAEDFIYALEASREGQRVGAWVLDEACKHAKAWEQLGIDDLRVAVNLSMPLLKRPDFTDLVFDTLQRTGLDGSKLELEVTERIIISAGTAGIAPKLAKLRDFGIHIALDDFGTGYSSLALLKDLPVDRIKIDRSFVAGFGTSADDTAIVRAVTNLGRSLSKRVTAEGVECPRIMDLLRREGCHDVQGYHLAKPMPASALVDFLKEARLENAP